MIVVLANSSSPGNVSQVSATIPQDCVLVGIDWSIVGIAGAGHMQATIGKTDLVSVPSDTTSNANAIISHCSAFSTGAFNKFVALSERFAQGSLVWMNLFIAATVTGNYACAVLHFVPLQPEPRGPGYDKISKQNLRSLTAADNPTMGEILADIPDIRDFLDKRTDGDPAVYGNVFHPAWMKYMSQHVITLREAFECFTDVQGDLLLLLEIIGTVAENLFATTNPFSPLERPELSGRDAWFLATTWTFGGLPALAEQVNLVGRLTGFGTENGLINYEPQFKFLRQSSVQRFVILMILRMLPYDSIRQRRRGKFVRRIPLLEEKH